MNDEDRPSRAMNEIDVTDAEDPLDRVIDFSNARPNPYFVAAVGAKYIRVLDQDLADVFPDNASVNEALRTLVRITMNDET
jgi:hypothetical protein